MMPSGCGDFGDTLGFLFSLRSWVFTQILKTVPSSGLKEALETKLH
jgi:hypothetical protein